MNETFEMIGGFVNVEAINLGWRGEEIEDATAITVLNYGKPLNISWIKAGNGELYTVFTSLYNHYLYNALLTQENKIIIARRQCLI